jgi:hypothetical protein
MEILADRPANEGRIDAFIEENREILGPRYVHRGDLVRFLRRHRHRIAWHPMRRTLSLTRPAR